MVSPIQSNPGNFDQSPMQSTLEIRESMITMIMMTLMYVLCTVWLCKAGMTYEYDYEYEYELCTVQCGSLTLTV